MLFPGLEVATVKSEAGADMISINSESYSSEAPVGFISTATVRTAQQEKNLLSWIAAGCFKSAENLA